MVVRDLIQRAINHLVTTVTTAQRSGSTAFRIVSDGVVTRFIGIQNIIATECIVEFAEEIFLLTEDDVRDQGRIARNLRHNFAVRIFTLGGMIWINDRVRQQRFFNCKSVNVIWVCQYLIESITVRIGDLADSGRIDSVTRQKHLPAGGRLAIHVFANAHAAAARRLDDIFHIGSHLVKVSHDEAARRGQIDHVLQAEIPEHAGAHADTDTDNWHFIVFDRLSLRSPAINIAGRPRRPAVRGEEDEVSHVIPIRFRVREDLLRLDERVRPVGHEADRRI